MLGSSGPVEAKVKAATGGSAAGVALAGLILWLLDSYAWRQEPIPDAVSFAVITLLPIGLTFAGGFFARHTARVDRDAVAGVHAAEVERLADRDAQRADLRRNVGGYTGTRLAADVPPPARRPSGHRLDGPLDVDKLLAPDGPAPGGQRDPDLP